MFDKYSLNDIRDWCVEYISKKQSRNIVSLDIHFTTALEKVKANVQGQYGVYNILISGNVKTENKLIDVVAHEVAHIITGNEHSQHFVQEVEKIRKFLEKKIQGVEEERKE